ncbi:MAG: 50S ribosomal protein L18 [Bdellovibrionales bacterium]|nr:50S ribosomal protein L18 [Bdellovibrionales bacterium]
MSKKDSQMTARQRRRYRIRKRISGSAERPRLSVYRSDKFTYAQLIQDDSEKTVFSCSTKDKAVLDLIGSVEKEGLASTATSSKSTLAAKALGLKVAELCKEKSIKKVVFDRGGYLYHGRIQAVAEGAREGGLEL